MIFEMKQVGAALARLPATVAAPGAAGDGRLIEAMKSENTQAATTLVWQGVRFEATDADGSAALHCASHLGRADLAEPLFEADANPNARTPYGISPLSLACTNESTLVDLLLAHGADPNRRIVGTKQPGRRV